jgi:2-phosphosulfolactate phosphatase
MRARGSYAVRFEWGPTGAAALAPSSSCLVIVGVLSFSTSVTVAVEAGTRVYPWWGSRALPPIRQAEAAGTAPKDDTDEGCDA